MIPDTELDPIKARFCWTGEEKQTDVSLSTCTTRVWSVFLIGDQTRRGRTRRWSRKKRRRRRRRRDRKRKGRMMRERRRCRQD